MKPTWEYVDDGLKRMQVPSGWLVQHSENRFDREMARWDWILVSTFFVPDAEHSWNIKE